MLESHRKVPDYITCYRVYFLLLNSSSFFLNLQKGQANQSHRDRLEIGVFWLVSLTEQVDFRRKVVSRPSRSLRSQESPVFDSVELMCELRSNRQYLAAADGSCLDFGVEHHRFRSSAGCEVVELEERIELERSTY